MGRLNNREQLSNTSSDHDVDASIYAFYYDDDDCLVVRGNTTSAACVNGTRDARLSLVDYYQYDDDAGSNFFDVYYSSTRFAVETTMALLSMTLNVLDARIVISKQPSPDKTKVSGHTQC